LNDPRRRGVKWTSVGHGVKIPSGLSGRAALLAELRAWQDVLPPGAAWTGLTAAEVHGLWMPTPTPGLPRFAATGALPGSVTVVRPELAISRHATVPEAVTIEGVRVVPVPDCIVAAGRFLPTLDLVVLLDSAQQLGKCTFEELLDAVSGRRRGVRPTRLALGLSDGRSGSAWETLLRVLHVVCGIDVETQVELFDTHGAFVARADLRVVGTDLLQEYDGADHQQARQQRKDLVRARGLADLRLERRGYVATEVLNQPHVILRAADEALGRAVRSDPGPWLQMVAGSLYRPAGRQALLERVRENWSHLPR